MSEQEPQPDVEPLEPLQPSELARTKPAPSRRSFSKLRRELSDEELGSPAVQRLLLDDIERLEGQARDGDEFREKFHSVDKKAAILEEKFRGKISLEVLSTACIAVGGVAIGSTQSVWDEQPLGVVLLGLGILILGAGIAAKAIKP